jgi:hypothetical protein
MKFIGSARSAVEAVNDGIEVVLTVDRKFYRDNGGRTRLINIVRMIYITIE